MKKIILMRKLAPTARFLSFVSGVAMLMASEAQANIIVMREGDSVDSVDWVSMAAYGAIAVIVVAIVLLLWRPWAPKDLPLNPPPPPPGGNPPDEIPLPPVSEPGVPQRCIRLEGLQGNGKPVQAEIGMREVAARSKGCYYTIGRQSDCDFRIGDSSVSRRHAELRIHRDEFTIGDLGSSFGTHLNGRKLETKSFATLHNGDRIQLGAITLVVNIFNK